MNIDPPAAHPEPELAVDPLDARLSALLDGSAATPGSQPEAASETETIDLDGEIARARRRQLETARDMLAIAPPPIDDLTRRKLVRTAVAASTASAPRSGRAVPRAAIAAAIVVAVLIGAVVIKSLDHNSTSSTERSASSPAAAPSAGNALLDFHEVSNPLVLQRRVEAALGTTAAAGPETVPHGSANESTTAAPPFSNPATTLAGPTPESSPASCVASVRVPAGLTPQLLGTATYHGSPALVVVARNGPQTLIFVVAKRDCHLLSSQFLRQ